MPVRQLILIFSAWKALLLLLAAFCPGPGYDTSALILLDPSLDRHENIYSLSRLNHLVLNLFRWDALYFASAAKRDFIFEQEWAFSLTYSRILRFTTQVVCGGTDCPLKYYVVAGVLLSHVFHLISVLVLYRLLMLILVPVPQKRSVAFIASTLHILTPASLFYSSPYAEALFAFLHISGMLLYAKYKVHSKFRVSSLQDEAYQLGSGFLFALATLVRSNGLLSGAIFLYDLFVQLSFTSSTQLSVHDIRRALVTCIAGSTIALAFIGPQYLAYTKYCTQDLGSETRPWCTALVPSAYSWVQSHYWNVGLFRYWTVSNIPLFLLAIPLSWILVDCSLIGVHRLFQHSHSRRHGLGPSQTKKLSDDVQPAHILPELELPQLLLTVAALTSFHVQIVNRIASAYPAWYIWIATCLVNRDPGFGFEKPTQLGQRLVRGMVMYAIVQGMLYANFLPPA